MKKLVSIILVIALLASSLLLTSCDAVALVSGLGKIFGFLKPLVSDHTHIWGPIPAVESTCTEHGLTEGKVCLDCGEIFVPQTETPLAAHQTITIPGYAPTCDATGLTDGLKCQNCLAIVVEGHVIPTVAHKYEVMEEVESTCAKHGLTEGQKCSVCERVFVEQQEAPLKGHTYSNDQDMVCNVCDYVRSGCNHSQTVTLGAKAATCTQTGLTEGKKCGLCGEIIEAQTVVPIEAHVEVTISAVPATCASTGLGAGKMCINCGEITKEQEVVPVSGHMWGTLISSVSATSSTTGTKAHYKCTGCSAVSLNGQDVCARVDLIIPALNDNGQIAEVLDFISNGDGTCYVSGIGTYKSKDIVIPANSPDGDRVTAIGQKAFYGLGELVSVTIPTGIVTICANAFYGCKIGTVNYTGSEDQWNDIIIENGNVALGTITRLHANDYGAGMSANNIRGDEAISGSGLKITQKTSAPTATLPPYYQYTVSSYACENGARRYYCGIKTVEDPSDPENQVLMLTTADMSALQYNTIETADLVGSGFGGASSSTLTFEMTLGAVNGIMPTGVNGYIRHRYKPLNSEVDGLYFVDLRLYKILNGEVQLWDGTVVGKIPETGMRKFTITVDTLSGKVYGYAEGESAVAETTEEAIIVASGTFQKRRQAYRDDPVANADLACYENLHTFFTQATGNVQHYFFINGTATTEFENSSIEVNGVMTKVKNADGSFNMAAVKALAERDYSFFLGDLRLGFKTVNCNYTGK